METTLSFQTSELLQKQRESVNYFFDHVDEDCLNNAVKYLQDCRGMVVITGVGKSGIIAEKMAQTLTSTGTQAIFLSPTNALHGDIGIVREGDLFVVLSKSGQSDEILSLIPFVRNRGVKILSIVFNKDSRLSLASDLTLELPIDKELCPFDMAPTISTTLQTIVGDLLAISLMKLKKFTEVDFISSHPAGRLGKRKLLKVKDLMIKDQNLPLCQPDDRLVDTLVELSNKQCGCVLIVDQTRALLGIFTDGDLRRALQENGASVLEKKMSDLMTVSARTTLQDTLAWDAIKQMEGNQKKPIMVIPVLDDQRNVVGLVKMHDLVQSGV